MGISSSRALVAAMEDFDVGDVDDGCGSGDKEAQQVDATAVEGEDEECEADDAEEEEVPAFPSGKLAALLETQFGPSKRPGAPSSVSAAPGGHSKKKLKATDVADIEE